MVKEMWGGGGHETCLGGPWRGLGRVAASDLNCFADLASPLQVPPMPPAQTRKVLEQELGAPLDQIFDWIDLEKPLGSASISQVLNALVSQ